MHFFLDDSDPPLHWQCLRVSQYKRNIIKFMRLVRPSGVRTLDMHARALEIKTQGVELFLNSFKKLNR